MISDRKSLSIAKNHPKPSQEFSEQFGPSIHEMKGFSRNSRHKVHPNFAQNLGRQILRNTFSGLKVSSNQQCCCQCRCLLRRGLLPDGAMGLPGRPRSRLVFLWLVQRWVSAWVQQRSRHYIPWQPIPPSLRVGGISPPYLRGGGEGRKKKHFKTRGFGQSAPLIKGAKCHQPLMKWVWVVRVHIFLFSEFISRNFAFQLHKNTFRALIARKLHYTMCDSEKNCLGINIIFLEYLVSVTQIFDSVNIWCIVFFPVLKPLACGRQARCLGWTYKLLGGQKFSIKFSPLSL